MNGTRSVAARGAMDTLAGAVASDGREPPTYPGNCASGASPRGLYQPSRAAAEPAVLIAPGLTWAAESAGINVGLFEAGLAPEACELGANASLDLLVASPAGAFDVSRMTPRRAGLLMTLSLTPPTDTRPVSPALRDVLVWAANDLLDVDHDADVALAVRVARGLLPLVLDCDLETCVAALDGHLDVPVDSDVVFDRAVAADPAGPCAAAACLTARHDPGVSLCWSHDAYVAAHFDADPRASLTFMALLLA